MATRRFGIIMHGVTGRMGYNQHLVRSIAAIRAEGGIELANGDRLMPDPILVGRNAAKVEEVARRTGSSGGATTSTRRWPTPRTRCSSTPARRRCAPGCSSRAIDAGKHVYCEKPISDRLEDAVALARKAKAAGVKNGVVQDKLFLPGLQEARHAARQRASSGGCSRSGASSATGCSRATGSRRSGRRGTTAPKDGGGIILDMLCHWRYVLDNLFGEVKAVSCLGATHIPKRVDEPGKEYAADADDAAYATFELAGGVIAQINSSWATRVRRDDLVTFLVDGTHGSAMAGLMKCWTQHRVNTPKPVWSPDTPQTIDFYAGWDEVPDNEVYDNGFKVQWEMFLRHLVEDAPWRYLAGRGRQGGAARRARAAELEGAALARRAGGGGLRWRW